MHLKVFHPGRLLLLGFVSCTLHAQISLSTAVELAERNSPRIKMAQADVARARASQGLAKDAFIPSVAANGGYGRSTGAPLSVPVIFSLAAQSLIYNFSQPDYIRSAHAGLQATEQALAEAAEEVSEDTTNTYIALANAMQRRAASQQAQDITARLLEVIQDRVSAGVDARSELTRAKITSAQIQLQDLSLRDEVAADLQHLASLTGVNAGGLVVDPQSIPQFHSAAAPAERQAPGVSAGIAAAYSVAKSRQFTARGDRRYLFLPQITLQANYSRVDTGLSSYTAYYPRFDIGLNGVPNSQNALGFGAALTIPLLDFAHRSRARETAADAAHALADARQQEGVFFEARARLQNSTQELDARSELARLNQELAQDQLAAIQLQMQPGAYTLAGALVTPKDQLNAQLQERLRYLDVLNAQLQLQQTNVNLLRLQGQLSDAIHRSVVTAPVPGTSPNPPLVVPGGSPAPTSTIPTPGAVNGTIPGASPAGPTLPLPPHF